VRAVVIIVHLAEGRYDSGRDSAWARRAPSTCSLSLRHLMGIPELNLRKRLQDREACSLEVGREAGGASLSSKPRVSLYVA
jgi:hypothetical protein